MIIFAENFRGFRRIQVDLQKTSFLLGDNSSGKSSILYLVEAVCSNDLESAPKIDEDFGASRFDYFSPFFDNADVHFGFLGLSKTKHKIGKIITVSKKGKDHPDVARCTYWYPGIVVTFKSLSDGVYFSIEDAPKEMDADALMRLHRRRRKLTRTQKVARGSIAEVGALIMQLDRDDDLHQQLIAAAWNLGIKPCRIVSPLRALPERFYSNIRRFDAQGAHFAKMWMDLADQNKNAFEDVDRFGQEAKLFENLKVEPVSKKIDDPPLLVTVERSGKRFTLDQVGIGVSQVTPMLMDIVFSINIDQYPVLSQQPELHLHPVAQAALGSYLYRAKKSGLVGIYETHSSFLLDRFRADFREDEEKGLVDGVADDVEIIFCQSTEKGNRARTIELCADGSLRGEPDEFHKFFIDELVRTMF